MCKQEHETQYVDLIGEIRLADLDQGLFVLRLDDGSKVESRFSTEQEELVTAALHEHATRRVRVKGYVEPDANGGRARITKIDELSLEAASRVEIKPKKSIFEKVLELGASVPVEEWDKVPTDLAKNLDHYLYGAPKKP
jgi:hypothetical protein